MRFRLCPDWASYEHATRFKFSPDNFFDDGWNIFGAVVWSNFQAFAA
jgi:hypothetical protein